MKDVVRKVNRSSLYHLINPITPINHALNAKFDAWGSLLVICLLLATVELVRLFLNPAQ
jgi:hypothetical protein